MLTSILRVRALAPPAVERRCSHCHTSTPFHPSGLFRLNGQGRRLDVCLIYRCERCDNAWNHRLFRRVLPETLGSALVRYERNDPELAWQHAFDLPALKRSGGVTHIHTPPADVGWTDPAPCLSRAIHVELFIEDPVRLRLDRVLGLALTCSRERVRQRTRDTVAPRLLKRPAVHGQRLVIAGILDGVQVELLDATAAVGVKEALGEKGQ